MFSNNKLLSEVYRHKLIDSIDLEKIIAAHHQIVIVKGQTIIQQGKIANSYLVLESGLMRSYTFDYNRQDITTDFYVPQDVVIDVLSLFQRIPAQENIQALTDCIAWEINFEDFQRLYHSIPGFSEWGRLWMTGKLFQCKQRFLEMITISAKNRYDKLLQERPMILLHSPLKYIASYLGITDTSFSRIRKVTKS